MVTVCLLIFALGNYLDSKITSSQNLPGQTNSQNNIWTVPRLESNQTQTPLPSYENVVCQQNYEFEEFYNPPSYNDAMVSGQWNYDQNSGSTEKDNQSTLRYPYSS